MECLSCPSVEDGLVQDRIASEFSRLQYLMSLSNQHPMIKSLEPVSSHVVTMVMVLII